MRTRCATGLRHSPENLSQPSKRSTLPAHLRRQHLMTAVHDGHHPAPAPTALRRPAMTTTAPVPSCPVDESFDPLSPEFLADPYAAMSALSLDGTPVFFAPSIGYYVITRYADIEAVFRDPAAYSAAVAQARWCRWSPGRSGSCWRAGTSPRRPRAARMRPLTPGCRNRPAPASS